MIAWALRALAIAIAILAVIDPVITSNRETHPLVAVVAGDASADSAQAGAVARALAHDVTVVRTPYAGVAATVVVGNALPPIAADVGSPAFAVLRDTVATGVDIERVRAPSRSPLDTRMPIIADVRVRGARGRTVDIALRTGDLVVDRAERVPASNDEVIRVPMSFAPTAVGAASLAVVATVSGAVKAAEADLTVDVHDTRWAVLFFDRRPSWMSTFVRRAVERDPRFVVTSRVVTSRNISTDAGAPPAAFDDLASLGVFDAVVVGAPEALTDRDVAGLDEFLRRRGGAVVMLLDQRVAGAYDRLTAVREWTSATGRMTVSASQSRKPSDGMRASDVVWPASLPMGARSLAMAVPASGSASVARPVVWESAVGAGRLLVSGALDAWTARDPAVSGFETFWQSTIADAAAGTPRAFDIDAPSLAVPGERVYVSVTLRDIALAPSADGHGAHASVSASLESADGRQAFRLWPTGAPGTLQGEVRAPDASGAYRIVIAGDGGRAEAPLIVANTASRPVRDERDLVRAWATSRGGVAFQASELTDLAARVRAAVRIESRSVAWHPMRSPWWIVPFALALGVEWWIRRRRGLA